jgi:hypothetical protein
VQHHRHPGAELSVYRRGYEWSPSGDDVHSEESDPAEQNDGDIAAEDVQGEAKATSHPGS